MTDTNTDQTVDSIGFVGLGNMGLPMAQNLLEAGYDVLGVDVDETRLAAFETLGGDTGTIAEAAAADAVVTMVRTPDQLRGVVRELYGELSAGALHVDMSTVGPVATEAVADRAAAAGVRLVDAPVSGGVQGAEAGTLAVMAGGESEDVAVARPLLETLGEDVFHVGESGAGQTAKLCLQVLVGAEIVSICEAFAVGAEAGLELGTLYEVLTASIGSSGILEAKGRRIVEGDYEPAANIDLQHKDMQLAMDAAERFDLPLYATAAVTQTFVRARREGLGELDQFALYELFDPADA
jgi:3-hydroxyisobutyrate dehydrogenase-like beta-hydroxyacid dehydrogenase